MAKKIKKYKVGCQSETYAISLVTDPAIEEGFMAFKKDEESIEVQLSSDEKHMLFGAVLVPDRDIYRNDGENEFYLTFSAEAIEKMSQNFMRSYRQESITLQHEEEAPEICVVESWIKSDMEKDKSVALGLNPNLPIGTWFCGMKVNNVESWDRVKSGELRGFSVESLIQLEEFNKIDKNKDNMDLVEDETFLSKLKEIVKDILSNINLMKEEKVEEFEAEATPAVEPTTTTAVEEPTATVEQPTVEEPTQVVEQPTEPTVEEPKTDEPKAEEPHKDDLSVTIGNLLEEIKQLREMNGELVNKVNELGSQPSSKPINTNGGGSGGKSTYDAWRSQMAKYL